MNASRKSRAAAVAGMSTVFALGLVGLFIGLAIQVDHPHQQAGWDASYWLSGLFIGLAAGVLFGGIAALAAWDITE